MSTPLSHSERVAVARLHAMLELLPTALDKRLGSAGVTAFEHTLLDALAQSEHRYLRMSDLARKTNAALPRISRVTSSLERRGLIERTPSIEDRRATNAALTPSGAEVHQVSQKLYAAAVRELVLEGLDRLPGDGIEQLSELSYAVLSSLDVETRTAEPACDADPDPAPECAADPAPENLCDADPAPRCAADPMPAAHEATRG